ncbi:triose-phosphate isomerase [Eisenibacter elegans]|jgi:triosephosphate isomerase|uniref:triose-phosphate isomerase n=1 Tax=Eisenibacter elegans TaxID=997 RepID=UPI00040C0889|nr:triose-phosphate isomerase [Eisenibacter elegans]
MRQKIVAGNWKMHKTLEEGQKLASEVIHMAASEHLPNVHLILATPFIHLGAVARLLPQNSKVSLAAQNCHHLTEGAYTGEVSAKMLQSIGVSYVLIGHSERRSYFHEDHHLIAQKVKAALAEGLTPIFCCGETLEAREADNHFEVVGQQLLESLFDLSPEQMQQVVVAYEPVWAIGTGRTASSDQAQEMHAFIRQSIAKQYGEASAAQISILYGGSCKPSNAAELFACPDVDGGLIGGASLVARDFIDIAKALS